MSVDSVPRRAATTAAASPAGTGSRAPRRRSRPYRRGRLGRGAAVVRAVLLFLAAAATLFPFYAMLVLSFKPIGPVVLPDSLLPGDLSVQAYERVLGTASLPRWLLNTAVYAVTSVIGVLALSVLAGYAFAKKRFPGKETMFWSFVAMLMVPYHVTLIPLFILVADWGGVDTYWGLIVPTLANAQAVFLIRQFIGTLPDELFDAARLDGCSELRILWSLVLPLTKPILATLGVFVFLWHWNDFLWPLVIGQSEDMRTLTVGIASLQAERVPLNVVLAGSVMAFVPIFMAYLVGQRYFTEGIATTGMKG